MGSFETRIYSHKAVGGRLSQVVAPAQSAWPSPALLSIQKATCILMDLFFIWAAALAALSLRFPAQRVTLHVPYRVHGGDVGAHVAFLLVYSGLLVLLANTQNLYGTFVLYSFRRIAVAVSKATALATLILMTFLYLSGGEEISRLVVAVTIASSFITMVGWRVLRRRWLRSAIADGVTCHHVLIVGTDDVAHAVKAHLDKHRELGLHVKGFLAQDWKQKEANKDALGIIEDLEVVARAHFIDELIVCGQSRETIKALVNQAQDCGVSVRVIPDLYDGLAWGAPVEHIGKFPAIHLYRKQIPAVALMVKRALDMVLAGSALFFLSPVFLVLTILVKLDSKGRVFYISRRVGRKGNIFACYKFRTMVTDAEELKAKLAHLNERDGILFKISNDPRITRVGRFLRKYSLDELAQLWNVLKGDMSLVGPRPPLASEVQQYEIDHLRRLEVAPGITGLWQVEARTSPSFDRYIELDLNYVRDWSLALDLKIILKTINVVFAGTGS